MTSSENQRHAVATGLKKSGEDNYQAKLTAEQVIYIRENPDGLNTLELAKKFGTDLTTIRDIQRGETWKNVGGPIRKKFWAFSRVPDDIRAEIIRRHQEGNVTCTALAKEFGYSVPTVCNIVNGK